MVKKIVLLSALLVVLYHLAQPFLIAGDAQGLAMRIVMDRMLWAVVVFLFLLVPPIVGRWLSSQLELFWPSILGVVMFAPIAFIVGARLWFEVRSTDLGTLLFNRLKIGDPAGILLVGSISLILAIYGWYKGSVNSRAKP